MAELSLQRSVYGSASWECKRGFISCICYKNLSSVSAQRHCGSLKSQTWSEKTWVDIKLLCGRALSVEICLWICQWGMREGMQYFHTLQNFISSVSVRRHCSGLKSQTWSEKHEHTSNFNVAELSLQKSIYGSTNWECKRGFVSCICYKYFSHQFQHEDILVGWRARLGLKNMSRHQTSTEQSSLYRCLFAALSVRDRRGDKGVSDSLVYPPIKTMHHFTHW